MAYRSRRRSTGRTRYSAARRPARRRATYTRRRAAPRRRGSSARTLRIVIEQPGTSGLGREAVGMKQARVKRAAF